MLQLLRKKFSEISDTKGQWEPIFQVLGGGKKRGGLNFFQNLRGEPKLTHYVLIVSEWKLSEIFALVISFVLDHDLMLIKVIVLFFKDF